MINGVLLIECIASFGTAFVVNGETVVSADHVFKNETCAIEGVPFVDSYAIPDRDFWSAKSVDPAPIVSLPYSCEPLKYREVYTLVGSKVTTYAVAQRKYVEAIMNGQSMRARAMFGEVFAGQSGGPVMDDDGNVRAIISGGNGDTLVTVIELADTPICY